MMKFVKKVACKALTEVAANAMTAVIVPIALVKMAKSANSDETEPELYAAYKAYINKNKTETTDSE